MSREYAWQCLICSASNDAGARACSHCGFPARATGREIAAARAAFDATNGPPKLATLPAVVIRRGTIDTIERQLDSLSAWRRFVVVTGWILTGGGIFALKAAWSFAIAGWGVLALVGGFACVGLGMLDRGPGKTK
jgi:hypothetical protein